MLFTLQDQLTALGKRIKARRLALDLTQQAAAAKAGVAHRTWRRMEAERLTESRRPDLWAAKERAKNATDG